MRCGTALDVRSFCCSLLLDRPRPAVGAACLRIVAIPQSVWVDRDARCFSSTGLQLQQLFSQRLDLLLEFFLADWMWELRRGLGGWNRRRNRKRRRGSVLL